MNEEPPLVYAIPPGEIASEVSSVLNIAPDLFHGPGPNGRKALSRAVVGYMGRKLSGHQIKGIAEHLNRDQVVMSQGIKRVEGKLREGKGFAQPMISVEQTLIQNSSRKIRIYL